jgi:hypothetical protein
MQAVRRVLDFGQWILGPSAPSPNKFLFRNSGDVFLLSIAKPSDTVRPLSEESLEQSLELPIDEFITRPILLLQTILDHNHWSYSNDLLATARLQARKQARQRAEAALPHKPELDDLGIGNIHDNAIDKDRCMNRQGNEAEAQTLEHGGMSGAVPFQDEMKKARELCAYDNEHWIQSPACSNGHDGESKGVSTAPMESSSATAGKSM